MHQCCSRPTEPSRSPLLALPLSWLLLASCQGPTDQVGTPDARVEDDGGELADAPSSGGDANELDAGWLDAVDGAGTDEAGTVAELTELTPAQAKAMLESEDVLLIDVRGTSTVQITGTDALVDYRDTDGLVAAVGGDLDRLVILYCASGRRSSLAGAALVGLGYRRVYHISGGISAWQNAGYATEP